jgi:hypothetical protein
MLGMARFNSLRRGRILGKSKFRFSKDIVFIKNGSKSLSPQTSGKFDG